MVVEIRSRSPRAWNSSLARKKCWRMVVFFVTLLDDCSVLAALRSSSADGAICLVIVVMPCR